MYSDQIVLCGANSYKQKYYFNQDFAALPQTVKEELQSVRPFYGGCGRRADALV